MTSHWRFLRPIALLLFMFAISIGCSDCDKPDNKKTREVLDIETRLKEAERSVFLGIQAYTKREILQAAQYFRDSILRTNDIEDYKTFPQARLVKAESFYWYGITMIDIYSSADPSSLVLYDENGNKVGTVASPELALKHVDKALELNPQPAAYYFGKGYIYLRSGDPQRAIGFFNTAIGMQKDNPNFYAFRATANYEMARRMEAKEVRGSHMRVAQEDCLRSIRLDNYNYEAHMTMLKLYILAGDMASAKGLLQEMDGKKLPIREAVEIYEKASR